MSSFIFKGTPQAQQSARAYRRGRKRRWSLHQAMLWREAEKQSGRYHVWTARALYGLWGDLLIPRCVKRGGV